MNPPTPGPLTVLLLSDDPALLADEAGGRVPQVEGRACNDESHGLWWAFDIRDEPPICEVCSAHKRWESGRALVLIHEGTPVAMGCDRAVRWVNAGERARLQVQLDYDDPAYIQVILHEAVKLGACVVLLRDGREVGS